MKKKKQNVVTKTYPKFVTFRSFLKIKKIKNGKKIENNPYGFWKYNEFI